MESFNSLLKFWRGATEFTGSTNIKTITMNSSCSTEAEEEKLDGADDGPFFDLEFKTPPVNVDTEDECSGEEDDETDCESAGTDDNDSERDYSFNSNLSFSPSDENLFFKGNFLQLANDDEEVHSKTAKRKSSVFKLGFKKTLSTGKVENNGDSVSPKFKKQTSTRQRIKVEEVPIISLFTRENSLRNHFNKQSDLDDDVIASEDKKFVKGVVQKYMKMIKPLYVSVSKRYGEKSRFYNNGSVTTSPLQRSSPKKYKKEYEDTSETLSKSPKQGSLPSGLRIVCKQLRKSRSASNFAAVSPVAQKQDDSMFQQEDGIQNAILHCKKSFNSPRDSSLLSRSISDPTHEKSFSEEMKFLDQNEADNEEYFDL